MKTVVVYNVHREGGGADSVAERSVELLREDGHAVEVFKRSSKDLRGLRGRVKAFVCGLYSPHTMSAFKALLTAFKPDVVLAHELYPLITPWIVRVCKKYGIPIVVVCHDYRVSCPVATHYQNGRICFECVGGHAWRCVAHNCCESYFKSLAYALRHGVARRFRLFDGVDLFLTPSEKATSILCTYGNLSKTRVMAIGNPAVADTDAVNDFALGDYVAYAGRFAPEKGFAVLAEAVQGTNFPVKAVGMKPVGLHPDRLLNGIEFTGHLEPSEMAVFLRQARMVVVPSLCHETFGLVVAEALSRQTPVIVSNLGALPDVAGPGGLAVPPGDKDALRDAIIKLWNNPTLCRDMALAGKAHVARYSNTVYRRHLKEALEQSVSNARQSPE